MFAISFPTHQIVMKICTIHLQNVFGSIYKNQSSNFCSIEDVVQNAPEFRFFQYHYAQFYKIFRAEDTFVQVFAWYHVKPRD